MKQTIEIEVPEGFEAKYNPEQNKIELIKKDIKSRSWKEYCENHPFTGEEIVISSCITKASFEKGHGRAQNAIYYTSSREEAKAFIALMKLRQLREEWIGDWRPDWTNFIDKYCIHYYEGKIKVAAYNATEFCMSFPTLKMSQEFINCFKDLLEEAKPLL